MSNVRPHKKPMALTLKDLKFPLLYAVELLLWLPLLASFYGTVAFLASKPIHSLDLQGKSLPANWEAAVPNHGKYLQGYLVSSSPVAFALVVASLLCLGLLLYQVHKAQVVQRRATGPSRAIAHAVAQGAVMAILVGVVYFVLSRVLIGTSAA